MWWMTGRSSSASKRSLRLTRRSRGTTRRRYFARAKFEWLEERALLTTTLFLDFGIGIGMGNVLGTTAAAFRDINGEGDNELGTGPDLMSDDLDNPLLPNSTLDFRPLAYDFNQDTFINNADITALTNAVLPLVQRALEPFDIDVLVAAASTIPNIVASLAANNAELTGRRDAYTLIVDARFNFFGGGSVGDNAGMNANTDGADGVVDNGVLFGIAAGDDLNAQFVDPPGGNNQDEAALVFSDTILATNTNRPGASPIGSAQFNTNLANRIAYTAVHEAFHTFGLIHTAGVNTNQLLLSDGDVIRRGSSDAARENPFIVTRGDLQHDNAVAQPNNYLYLRNDPDIGLRDDDRDGVPNLAYVTGTGAFDRITLRRHTTIPNFVHVTVAAHSNATFSAASLIRQETLRH
jgi:hypothetical protein